VGETFKHCKAILAIGAGVQLLHHAAIDRFSPIQIAGDKNGADVVVSHGVISVYQWSATAPPSGGADEQKEGSGMLSTMASTVTSAVTSAIGAATGANMSEYLPNDAVSQFIDAMKKHRDWTRDVARFPA